MLADRSAGLVECGRIVVRGLVECWRIVVRAWSSRSCRRIVVPSCSRQQPIDLIRGRPCGMNFAAVMPHGLFLSPSALGYARYLRLALMTDSFEIVRGWAAKNAKRFAEDGIVRVVEPQHPNASLTVNFDLRGAIAQLSLWPNGMVELQVLAVSNGEEVATHTSCVTNPDALREICRDAARLIGEVQSGRWRRENHQG